MSGGRQTRLDPGRTSDSGGDNDESTDSETYRPAPGSGGTPVRDPGTTDDDGGDGGSDSDGSDSGSGDDEPSRPATGSGGTSVLDPGTDRGGLDGYTPEPLRPAEQPPTDAGSGEVLGYDTDTGEAVTERDLLETAAATDPRFDPFHFELVEEGDGFVFELSDLGERRYEEVQYSQIAADLGVLPTDLEAVDFYEGEALEQRQERTELDPGSPEGFDPTVDVELTPDAERGLLLRSAAEQTEFDESDLEITEDEHGRLYAQPTRSIQEEIILEEITAEEDVEPGEVELDWDGDDVEITIDEERDTAIGRFTEGISEGIQGAFDTAGSGVETGVGAVTPGDRVGELAGGFTRGAGAVVNIPGAALGVSDLYHDQAEQPAARGPQQGGSLSATQNIAWEPIWEDSEALAEQIEEDPGLFAAESAGALVTGYGASRVALRGARATRGTISRIRQMDYDDLIHGGPVDRGQLGGGRGLELTVTRTRSRGLRDEPADPTASTAEGRTPPREAFDSENAYQQALRRHEERIVQEAVDEGPMYTDPEMSPVDRVRQMRDRFDTWDEYQRELQAAREQMQATQRTGYGAGFAESVAVSATLGKTFGQDTLEVMDVASDASQFDAVLAGDSAEQTELEADMTADIDDAVTTLADGQEEAIAEQTVTTEQTAMVEIGATRGMEGLTTAMAADLDELLVELTTTRDQGRLRPRLDLPDFDGDLEDDFFDDGSGEALFEWDVREAEAIEIDDGFTAVDVDDGDAEVVDVDDGFAVVDSDDLDPIDIGESTAEIDDVKLDAVGDAAGEVDETVGPYASSSASSVPAVGASSSTSTEKSGNSGSRSGWQFDVSPDDLVDELGPASAPQSSQSANIVDVDFDGSLNGLDDEFADVESEASFDGVLDGLDDGLDSITDGLDELAFDDL